MDGNINELTGEIIGAAFEVRKNLGRFLYEEVYEQALQHELKLKGISCERQVYLPVFYKGLPIDKAYRIDLLVENKIIIELKALEYMGTKEVRQILSYLTLAEKKVGLLMNFGAADFSIGKYDNNFKTNSLLKGIYRLTV